MEESEIIAGCIRNQPHAQRCLFDRHYKRTFHVAMRYLANYHDTEDVLSVSYTRIFKNISHFENRGEGSFQKWINTIVINEAIRFLKSKKALLFQEDEDLLTLNVSFPDSSDLLDAEEVSQVVESMPKGYRTVFNLFAIEGYSHKEIAEMLQINENTSKSQLSKARNYMILKLKKSSHALK
ncbi:RNA polymerase sigma factor [Aquiflexum gelatinilyticum]|uniref:Sigma-70 family RNA polymerase sigma factor n=1 Tax=Aquiflexum gelatinilyticum TaxID=2961943 RepID=A0A9X2P810_9BACT|nr:sigma-70 family RNA polymerase sigma factor [Aquiflexum gelatinilyticum]MCR9014864.1 sigma-70 family RNA polymerase sigma factor [Aquiflexum gelatinilyticum]